MAFCENSHNVFILQYQTDTIKPDNIAHNITCETESSIIQASDETKNASNEAFFCIKIISISLLKSILLAIFRY